MSHVQKLLGAGALCAGLTFLGSTVQAQDPNYKFIAPDVVGLPGDVVTLAIHFDVLGTDNVFGWSMGISVPPPLTILSASDGAIIPTINGGNPPGFNALVVHPNEGTTVGLVVDLFLQNSLGPGTGYEVQLIDVMIPNAPLGTVIPIDFVETIGSPPVVNTVVLTGAVGTTPTLCSGSITVDVPPGESTNYGCGVNPAGSLSVLAGAPTLGATLTLGVDNPLATQAVGSIPFLALALAPDPNFPCGTPVPGFGMSGAGASGEFLISLVPPNPLVPILVGPLWTGPPAPIDIVVPNDPALVGTRVSAQGLMLDPAAASGVKFGLTEGLRLNVGP